LIKEEENMELESFEELKVVLRDIYEGANFSKSLKLFDRIVSDIHSITQLKRAGRILVLVGTGTGIERTRITYIRFKGYRVKVGTSKLNLTTSYMIVYEYNPESLIKLYPSEQNLQMTLARIERRQAYYKRWLEKHGLHVPKRRNYYVIGNLAYEASGHVGTPYGWYKPVKKPKAKDPYAALRAGGVYTYPGDPELEQKLAVAVLAGRLVKEDPR